MAMLDSTDPPVAVWDEGLWDELLAYVEAGIVVPIVGPACYPVETENGRVTIDRYVAGRLAERLALHAAAGRSRSRL